MRSILATTLEAGERSVVWDWLDERDARCSSRLDYNRATPLLKYSADTM